MSSYLVLKAVNSASILNTYGYSWMLCDIKNYINKVIIFFKLK